MRNIGRGLCGLVGYHLERRKHFIEEKEFVMSNNNVFDRARGYGAQGLKAGINVLGGFQQFILRGNVIDLAVGIVIGAAFTTVINGAVSDLLQPLIGRFVGTTNFDSFAPGGFKIGHLFGVLVTFLLTA